MLRVVVIVVWALWGVWGVAYAAATIDVDVNGAHTFDADTVTVVLFDADTTHSDTLRADTLRADATGPDVINPDVINPDTLRADATRPDTINPDTTASDKTGITPFSSLDYKAAAASTQSEKVPGQTIWTYQTLPGSYRMETDSTLRWKSWIDLTDLMSHQPGFIPFRTGMIQRKSGWFHHTYRPDDLVVELNGLSMSDPLTGQPSLYRIPIQHVRSMSMSSHGTRQQLEIRTRDHYIIKPRTYLHYDESDFNYRHLEFAWQQNIIPGTHLELSFWDRRDGTGYSRGSTEGNQIGARLRHTLSAERTLWVGLWQNRANKEESFGYDAQDPELFSYNRFTARPIQVSARSSERFRDIYVQVHEGDSTSGVVRRMVGFHVREAGRELMGPVGGGLNADASAEDTTGTNLLAWEFVARLDGWGKGRSSMARGTRGTRGNLNKGNRTWNQEGKRTGFESSLRARLYYLQNMNSANLSGRGWAGGELSGDAVFTRRHTSAGLHAEAGVRGDGFFASGLAARFSWNPVSFWQIALFSAADQRMPDLQSLYRTGSEFQGISEAKPGAEHHWMAGTEHLFLKGRSWTAGVRGEWRSTFDEVQPDLLLREFVQYERINRRSASAWLNWENPRWEAEIFASYLHSKATVPPRQLTARLPSTFTVTTNSAESMNDASALNLWSGPEEAVRLGGDVFHKRSVFSNAAYIKAGVRGWFVPYQSAWAMYEPLLNRWQMSGTGDDGLIRNEDLAAGPEVYRPYEASPRFRLDAELSARIRWFMLLLRWENAAEGLGSAGTMETLSYPMPSRRLIFSLRVLFVN